MSNKEFNSNQMKQVEIWSDMTMTSTRNMPEFALIYEQRSVPHCFEPFSICIVKPIVIDVSF